jgi:hypothetical protein
MFLHFSEQYTLPFLTSFSQSVFYISYQNKNLYSFGVVVPYFYTGFIKIHIRKYVATTLRI